MGLIRSVLKCFCFDIEDDQHQPSDASRNCDPLTQRLLISSASSDLCSDRSSNDSISTDTLDDRKELECQESLDYHSDSSVSELLQQEELISSASFLSSNDSNLQNSLDSEDSSENVEEREEEVIEIVVREEKWINHYSSFQKILLVGEGDFSFSACLAMAFGSASNIIATSLDSNEFLRTHYQRATSNIEKLKSRGCKVMHGVDATKMAHNSSFTSMRFDRIIYNFPHAGFFKSGPEPREHQLSKHQELVSLFLRNAKAMINEDGEIHITHKTNSFHRDWNLELLASGHGLRLVEALHFNYRDYPGYRTKCGFGGDNFFNCNPSKTYKFNRI